MPLVDHGWRNFHFFDRLPAKSGKDERVSVFEGLTITKWVPAGLDNSSMTLFAEPNGIVLQLARDGYEVQIWKAHQHHLIDISANGYTAVTIGMDTEESNSPPMLKLWDLSVWSGNTPSCKLSSRIHARTGHRHGHAPHSYNQPLATAVAINQRADLVVVGFEDTSVIFAQLDRTSTASAGDKLTVDKLLLGSSSSIKFKSMREGATTLGSGKLVGLVVCTMPVRAAPRRVGGVGGSQGETTSNEASLEEVVDVVLVLSTVSLHSYLIRDGQVTQTLKHDVLGCPNSDCWSFSTERKQLVVAGKEMVHIYDLTICLEQGAESGKCYALMRGEGSLIQLLLNGGCVAMLSRTSAQLESNNADKPTSSDSMATGQSATSAVTLTIYDTERAYVAFTTSVPSPSCKAFTLGGELHLAVGDAEGTLLRIVEKPLAKKLEALLKRSLYDLAIDLSKAELASGRGHLDSEAVKLLNDLHVQYGDYLYGRGDFDNSIRQYMEAIDHVEPSYVIQKFLDGSRLRQLCSYLELLHQRGLAAGAPQYTTLLLTAYIKLQAKDKIDEFVGRYQRRVDGEPTIDVNGAIEILRSSDCSRAAAKLALAHSKPDSFLSILIEDTRDFANAVKFLAKLPTADMLEHLERHGAALLEGAGPETAELIHRIVREKGEPALKRLTKVLSGHPTVARQVFATFIRSSEHGGVVEDVELRNVMLEQLLSSPTSAISDEDDEGEERILRLAGPDNYHQALQLAQLHNFSPLVVHVLRKQNRTEELLRYLLSVGNIDDAIRCCGEEALKNMWIDLITYASAKDNLEPTSLVSLLERVTATNSVHPLVVLEILSRNSALKVGHIKDYIVGWLSGEKALIAENERSIATNEARIEQMEREIDDLANRVQTFQTNKCVACKSVLHLPTVHFLCKHSYHAHCFEEFGGGGGGSGDGELRCPACRGAEGNGSMAGGERRKKEGTAVNYQRFRADLNEATDVIGLISKYIGEGAFD